MNLAAKKIDSDEINKLIMVRPPYNSLMNFKEKELGILSAEITNEYLYENEVGPIGGAEFGRHAAILGSIAVTRYLKQTSAFYYLAMHAKMIRCSKPINNSSLLKVEILEVSTKKRNAQVKACIKDIDNNIIFEGFIDYLIMPQNIFSKFFASNKIEELVPHAIESPYKIRKKLSELIINGEEAKAEYGIVKAEHCLGHFDYYPALPVAIVGNLLSQIAIELFLDYTQAKYSKVLIKEAEINSENLSFYDDYISLSAKITKKNKDGSLIIESFARGYRPVAKSSVLLVGIV